MKRFGVALAAVLLSACGLLSVSCSGGSGAQGLVVDQVDAAASEPPADHPRIVDSQRARIFNAQVAADKQVQANALARRSPPRKSPNNTPNFTVPTGSPVVGAVAVYGASFTAESASDQMYFGVNGSGNGVGITSGVSNCTSSTCNNSNFFALNNIYSSTPTLAWSSNVGGGTTASVVLSADGTKVYVLGNSGTLYCFQSANGSTCSGWTNPSISGVSSAITPWVDSGSNTVYVHDGSGNLYSFNATTGAQQWKLQYSTSASKAWPVEASNIIYIGDGAGKLWRIVDPGTGATPTTYASATLSGVNGNCSGSASIDGSVSLDTTSNLVFLPWQACIYTFQHYTGSGTWAVNQSGWTASNPDKTFQTWPSLDGTYVYWVIADVPTSYTNVSSVWKTTYSPGTVAGTVLVNASSSTAGASVGSAPVVYSGNLYVGDQQGYVEEFGCASSKATATQFLAQTNKVGGPVNTSIVFDDATGNIEFGFGSGASNGVAQFPLWEGSGASNFSWNCPTGMVPCDNQICGTGQTSTQCVPSAECNTGVACSTVAAAGATIQVGYANSEGASVAGTQGTGGNQICPNGNVIIGVLGASYGTPPASPDDPVSGNTFQFNSACYATDSLSVTQSQCPLDTAQNCTFDAYNGTFGDPCVGTGKHYYAWFACGTQVPDAGSLPVLCSRQNVTPTGSDPCIANPDGGAAYCSGTCLTGWGDCNNNLQYDGCETYVQGSDASNCGSCGNICSGATPYCKSGSCSATP